MSALIQLSLLISAGVLADAFAAESNATEPARQLLSQPSSVAPPETAEQSPAAPPSTSMREATTPDPSLSGKSRTDTKTDRAPTSPAKAKQGEQKPAKNVLVDDTVTDAQLRQILARGYKPTAQAPGNEVSYCRREQLAGGRFTTTVCKTATRILEDEQRGKDLLDSMDRISQQTGR